ncbi:hypothetical protein COCNU_scaffold000130G000040 [Cocos nucifera]|nr:hypothetical protein [Cocos nucifera]
MIIENVCQCKLIQGISHMRKAHVFKRRMKHPFLMFMYLENALGKLECVFVRNFPVAIIAKLAFCVMKIKFFGHRLTMKILVLLYISFIMSMVVFETYAKDANYGENSSKNAPYGRMEETMHQLPRDLNLDLQTSGRIGYKYKVYPKRLVKEVVDTKLSNDHHILEEGSKKNYKMNDAFNNIDMKDNHYPLSKSSQTIPGDHYKLMCEICNLYKNAC